MSERDPCAGTKPLDDLIDWWKTNQSSICKNPHMAKKYCDLTRQIEDYRRKSCDVMTIRHHLEIIILHIGDLRLLNNELQRGLESANDCFCRRWSGTMRKLDRLAAGGGFATQALVTRWLYEAGFQIADIEVTHKDDAGRQHSFDVEIEDVNGNRYDVEVWHGMGVQAHESQRSMFRVLSDRKGAPLCIDDGAWDATMQYVSKYGGIGNDTEANFRSMMKKVGQLRKDRIGFVIACIQPEPPATPPLIPKKWGRELPEKKCIIVLRLGGGEVQTADSRGTGYLVHSPEFESVEAAKGVIQSLKFECDPDGDSLAAMLRSLK